MAGLSPLEMLQEFQVHYDKVDADSLPRMYPEEVYLFLNDAQWSYVVEARKAVDAATQLSEDLAPLVVDVEIPPGTNGLRTTYFPSLANYPNAPANLPGIPYAYFLMGHLTGTYHGKKGTVTLREVSHNEWEATLQNPHTSPRPSLCPYRYTQAGIVVATPPGLVLGNLAGAIIRQPDPIGPTQACTLPAQLHRPLVMKAVDLARAAIERGTQTTRGQA